jgi:nicotinate-nucleotide adenylyltransferase
LKVGVFGGTFNPIHYGHLRAAEEVREKLGFDRILFIPSGKPPLKTKDIAAVAHRFEMARLAVLDNTFFEISDIETKRTGKSYTVKTIENLKKECPSMEFYLILGIDAFLDTPNWRHPERLIELANFVIISRPGFRFADLRQSPYIQKINSRNLKRIDDAEQDICTLALESRREAVLIGITPMQISATVIRNALKEGKSIKYLLPAEVRSYIINNKLYKN